MIVIVNNKFIYCKDNIRERVGQEVKVRERVGQEGNIIKIKILSKY